MKKLSARAYFFKKTFDFFMIGMFVVLLLFLWTLYKGPIAVPFLKPYIIQALNYDENDYKVKIGDVNIEFVRSIQPIRVTANKIRLDKKDDTLKIEAPKLYLSFSLRALLNGIIAPSDVIMLNPKVQIYATYGVEEEHKNESGKKKLKFYVEKFNEFLRNYNSEDKIYPESYVNNITVKNGEFEFYEVDFGRKWLFSDVNFEFNRHLINMMVNANTLVNLNDKIASVGFEGEYHSADDNLDLEFYFSDMILSDVMSSFNDTTEENILSAMSIEVPVNGKISTQIQLHDLLQHPENAEKYINQAIEKINFEIDGGQGYIAFENEEKYNYDIDEMQLSGVITGGLDKISIQDADFKMGGQKASVSFETIGLQTYFLEKSLADMKMNLNIKIKEFAMKDLSRFWPRYLAEPGWLWCKDGLVGGDAENGEFVFDFGYNEKEKNWGLLNLTGKTHIKNGDVFYLEGMPLVRNLYGTAHFSKKNISIDIEKADSDNVLINGGNVNIYDLDKEDNFISIKLTGKSSTSDALKLIDNPPLYFAKDAGLDPEKISGNVKINLNLDFELRRDLNPKDIKVKVDADLQDTIIKDIVPNHLISAPELKLQVTSKNWSLAGDGYFDELPVTLKMHQDFDNNGKYNIAFNLDDTAKKILGIDWDIIKEPNIKGDIKVVADAEITKNNQTKIYLNADLRNAAIDYSFLGMLKKKGEEGNLKAVVHMNKDKISAVKNIELTKSDLKIEGTAEMYASGRLKLVDIHKISGPKTSARAKVNFTDKDKTQIKIDVSGTSYDLRPLFDQLDDYSIPEKPDTKVSNTANEDDGLEQLNDTDIFITVNSLWTNDTTPIQNFAGNAKLRRNIGIDEVNMVGNYGIDKSIKLNLSYMPRGNNEHFLSIESNNAGSTLKVLRLYENMVGGTLKIEARRLADKKFVGHAAVRDFSIHNAPVVAKILSVASFTGMLDLLKGEGLTFTHFNAPFEYQHKVLNLKHAKAEGNVIGITSTGYYNRATDDVKLFGVIAPAYSLNRFLGKIPLLGNLLASKDGTIFAADYKAEGSVKDLDVDVNSLSILSPNSMKEWYKKNFGDGEDL